MGKTKVMIKIKVGIFFLISFYTFGGQLYEGVSNKSFGRFGWTTYGWITEGYPLSKGAERYCEELRDGTLANLIKENFCVSRPPCDFYLIRRENLKKIEVIQCNWVGKTIKATYPEFYYSLTYSVVTSGILIESNDSQLTVYTSCPFTFYSFIPDVSLSAQYILERQPVVKQITYNYKRKRDGDIAANWILIWSKDGKVPLQIVFARHPEEIEFSEDGDRVNIKFKGPLRYAVVLTPFGVDTSSKKLQEGNTLSGDILKICNLWSRALLAYPVNCREFFEVEEGWIRSRDIYEYKEIKDDWGTSPLKLAPLPPLVCLAKEEGYPVKFLGDIEDCNYPTWYGPLKCTINKEYVEYLLPVPPIQFKGLVRIERSKEEERDVLYRKKINEIFKESIHYIGGPRRFDEIPSPWQENISSPNLDLYSIWGYYYRDLLSLPYLDFEAKNLLLDAVNNRIGITLSKYGRYIPKTVDRKPKGEIDVRKEPYTGQEYLITFASDPIPPESIQTLAGIWRDQDEAIGQALHDLYYYALYTGNWESVRQGWEFPIKPLAMYLEVTHDWAIMCASALEGKGGSGLDMLNPQFPGLLCYSKLAKYLRDEETYRRALYLASKTAVPTVIRFRFKKYASRYNIPGGDPQEIVGGFMENGESGRWVINPYKAPRNNLYFLLTTMCFLDDTKGLRPELLELYLTYVKDDLHNFVFNIVPELYPDWYRGGPESINKEEKNKERMIWGAMSGLNNLDARIKMGEERKKIDSYLEKFIPVWERVIVPKEYAPRNGKFIVYTLASLLSRDSPIYLLDTWAPAKFIDASYNPETYMAQTKLANPLEKVIDVEIFTKERPKGVIINEKKVLEGKEWFYKKDILSINSKEKEITIKIFWDREGEKL